VCPVVGLIGWKASPNYFRGIWLCSSTQPQVVSVWGWQSSGAMRSLYTTINVVVRRCYVSQFSDYDYSRSR
jgi:hypothetical protein